MTTAGRQNLSVGWQTWLVLAGTIAVGRWLAGGGFGYTLFAVVWAPLAVAFVRPNQSAMRRLIEVAALVGLFVLPWWIGWTPLVALRLTVWLTLFVGTVAPISSGLRLLRMSEPIAAGLTAVLWMSWAVIPLLMASEGQRLIGDAGIARVLALQPVLISNAVDTKAGDWTHQSVAYAHLTRLGQDVPFTWGSSGWAFGFYAACTIAAVIVPRGTVAHHR